jgi:primosomal protein N' (replication factor Y)
MKRILDVLDDMPLFPESMVAFFRWIADYYIHPIGEVIRTALPQGLNYYESVLFSLTQEGREALGDPMLAPLEAAVLEKLSSGPCSAKSMARHLALEIPRSLLRALAQRGLVHMEKSILGGTARQRMVPYVSLQGGKIPEIRMTPQRQRLIELLQSAGEMAIQQLNREIPRAAQIVSGLAGAGVVNVFQKPLYRDPFGDPIASDEPPELTGEQREVLSAVLASIGKGYKAYLLAGVTGSGKTEVYLQAAKAAMERDVSVLVLVPEIGLISQTERRFRARFGEVVAILHSGLSVGERYDQWRKICRNEVKIVVGARSAVFAPFQDLGLIIVDEEHDGSYKQENGLRYNARDLAVMRARQLGSVVLLGSATPSVQSAYNVSTGKFTRLSLTKRVADRPMPSIQVVDLKPAQGHQGVKRFITPELHSAIKQTLAKGEQSLLFLNRRGFASFPVCRTCGDPLCCQHCDVSMTLHQKSNAYKCHYCGFSRAASATCPTCGSSHIQLSGIGTEKIESAVQRLFPAARVARMDRDTTTRKGAIRKLLKAVKESRIDILVGTQMIAKGHDFPNITLVGIICADLTLSFPDFRAGERTYQLLGQVSGRAGRGDRPGRVVLQTYNPTHFSILCAKEQDYAAFYQHEIGCREALRYPPFTRLIQIRITGKDQNLTRTTAQTLGESCQAQKRNGPDRFDGIDILGPIASPLARVADQYRWQILLKGTGSGSLHRFVQGLMSTESALFSQRRVNIHLDVDPYQMV